MKYAGSHEKRKHLKAVMGPKSTSSQVSGLRGSIGFSPNRRDKETKRTRRVWTIDRPHLRRNNWASSKGLWL